MRRRHTRRIPLAYRDTVLRVKCWAPGLCFWVLTTTGRREYPDLLTGSQAAVGRPGSKGLADWSTPEIRCTSLRIAAPTITIGRLPRACSRSAKARTAGLWRIATIAGRYR